jgi:hypothetical protein
MNAPKFKIRTFRLWSYDVWGNARDGFDVNDRYKHGVFTIKCKREVFNSGTPHEFASYEPTDRQLSRAASICGASWDGCEGVFYAEKKSNGMPICELIEE